jgi:hypothetical protein
MNERELISRIKQDLNYGTGRLKTQVTDGLRQSRERALDAYAAQSQSENAYAFAGQYGHGHHFISRKWLPLAFVSLLLIGVVYWQQQDLNNEENIDVALLTSEIPLNAFVDQNFHRWLDQTSQN